MDQDWQTYRAWVAYFDILGFKEELKRTRQNISYLGLLQCKIDEIIEDLQAQVTEFKNVDCLFYADTFIFYSKSNENRNYAGIVHVATHFIERCLGKGIPLRGAISFGNIAVGYDKRCLIGEAFLESHLYAEDQNWLGLILTPSASRQVKEIAREENTGLDPVHHGFINRDIPLQKYSIFDDEIYAYTFCRGIANFPCPHLEKLREMKKQSPEFAKVKYENTIKFIEKYDKVDTAGGRAAEVLKPAE
jgi:hypothetical protein